MLSSGQQIVLASGNAGKIREIQAILVHQVVVPQAAFNVVECEETGATFIENAILKARNAAAYSGLPALADDSGLLVDALNGAPGVKSARYAGDGASDQDNVKKLLQALDGVPDGQRSARFVCVIALLEHADDPCPVVAQGVWEGRILHQPMGSQGFGYDPVFWVPGHHCSSALLPAALKNALSHRGQALRQLLALLEARAGVAAG
ncbi:MAG: RdgB/HAM1 family non-canonical purine NTP pyrophosphatase [Methylovulum sp.]|uniref:RdgB/HAM1 family non-canonical purine NTP pyrophosphatase n=1 Tax=Methylovulum sp. TaxID=1916980 RepID=UPI0026034468|nr:RdgB/HAM1 family non-canonical purine NTP pyrophosphatase [Methylovulum sp.]MDD2723618.1 RdgB/HAM1 family non-canonical purine NTP pyrophosphatase [Methylovulum sp.]MDD5124317.1 RdgB/HAM1 family non-canonical purine NTP pyrophosphatase [Methylovulum sp.]